VLFVCLGNICRSPTAEGAFRHFVAETGLGDRVEVDSAGTGGWHAGEAPDRRMRQAAAAQGITVEGRARQVRADDFERFHWIVAMDRENLADLHRLAPAGHGARIVLLRDFDPEGGDDVPDPYYGGARGFDEVVDIVRRSCRALFEEVRADWEA